MRDYYIYLIKEEFANHYYGRESMIYNLFLEEQKTSYENKKIAAKQINYITRQIPSLRLHQTIEMNLKRLQEYKVENNTHIIEIKKSIAKLTLHDRFIHLESKGNYDAETIIFELLRKHDRYFLAMDFFSNRFGWLTPLKERKLI